MRVEGQENEGQMNFGVRHKSMKLLCDRLSEQEQPLVIASHWCRALRHTCV